MLTNGLKRYFGLERCRDVSEWVEFLCWRYSERNPWVQCLMVTRKGFFLAEEQKLPGNF